MTVYVILFLILVVGVYVENERDSKINIYATAGAMLLVLCCRDVRVGVDLMGYTESFFGLQEFYEQEDNGFILLNNQLARFVFSSSAYVAIMGCLSFIPMFFFFKKTSERLVLSLLIYFFMSEQGYLFTFSGIRQSLASCLLMWCFYFCNEKKYIYSGLLFLISLTFHFSSFFCILYILLALFVNLPKKYYYLLLVASFFSGIIFSLSVIDVLEYLPYIRNNRLIQYIDFYTEYNEDFYRNIMGILSINLAITLLAFLVLYFDTIKHFYCKLFFWGVVFCNFFINEPIICRHTLSMVILATIVAPMLLEKEKDEPTAKLWIYLYFGLSIAIFWWLMYRLYIYNVYNFNYVVPYYFFWEGRV